VAKLAIPVVMCVGASCVDFAPGFALANSSAIPVENGSAADMSKSQDAEYRIGPLDKLDITVFQVKDLTLDKVQVDASGQVLLPLIGVIDAGGKTARQLSEEIASKLDANYMQDAQVSVLVDESASQKVTVEGAVTEAGVFALHGHATLLQAIAMAKGASKTADLKKVTVFRTVNGGVRQTLEYNLSDIQRGRQNDPEVEANDVVVVKESASKNALQDAVAIAPALYILTLFHF
jgi:polysaccharide export outer membrane protein